MLKQKYFPRLLEETIKQLFPEKQAIVITGMRRVGKTTLLKRFFSQTESDNKLSLDLEDVVLQKIFSQADFSSIARYLEQEKLDLTRKAYLFIDEIQLVKQMPAVMKYLYDKFDIKFLVSGSSSFYLKNMFTQSMSGRKFILDLYPLTFGEFLRFKGVGRKEYLSWKERAEKKNKFDEERYSGLYAEYLAYGGFPEVVLASAVAVKERLLADILNSYFQIDVAGLADFKNLGKLRDLLVLLSRRVGSKTNITNLATTLEVGRPTIYSYLEFLQATFVIRAIPRKTSPDNQVVADSKIYFCDTGLANSLGKLSSGSQLENGVLMSLAYNKDICYYQTKSGGEIDFVVGKQVALEVKETPSQRDWANLQKRMSSAGIKEGYLVGVHYHKTPHSIMAWDL